MSLREINTILKGGRGSGDWGHVGRAGKRGGSGGGGGKGKPRKGRRSREALDKEIESRKKPKEDEVSTRLGFVAKSGNSAEIAEFVAENHVPELDISAEEIGKRYFGNDLIFDKASSARAESVGETASFFAEEIGADPDDNSNPMHSTFDYMFVYNPKTGKSSEYDSYRENVVGNIGGITNLGDAKKFYSGNKDSFLVTYSSEEDSYIIHPPE